MNKKTPITGWQLENTYAELPHIFFTRQAPDPVKNPNPVVINKELAVELGLDPQYLESEDGLAVLAGNQVPNGAVPLAQAYAGHQFGHFTMLGDGRAILLGEQITPRNERFDIQLKGAGRTPYSRGGDGRAALGPMLREYLISEAMHALHIPTTRSLAVVTTGEPVYREETLSGAILTRVARSHLRVGTFQFAAAYGEKSDLQALADYAIDRHLPELAQSEDKYAQFLAQVVAGQALLVAKWMLVGFVHGVMNTDNMSICGEAIDFGPCAFLDTYHPDTVFSSIDHYGRYAYRKQPGIALWNLTRLAEAILPLLDPDQERAVEMAEEILKRFPAEYEHHWTVGMGKKLGLTEFKEGDGQLFRDLLELMAVHKADYTNTFLDLTFGLKTQSELADSEDFKHWHERWRERLAEESTNSEEQHQLMRQNNPAVIPRNHRVEEALRAAVQDGDLKPFYTLSAVLKDPFAHSPEQAEYAEPPPPSAVPYRTFCGT